MASPRRGGSILAYAHSLWLRVLGNGPITWPKLVLTFTSFLFIYFVFCGGDALSLQRCVFVCACAGGRADFGRDCVAAATGGNAAFFRAFPCGASRNLAPLVPCSRETEREVAGSTLPRTVEPSFRARMAQQCLCAAYIMPVYC